MPIFQGHSQSVPRIRVDSSCEPETPSSTSTGATAGADFADLSFGHISDDEDTDDLSLSSGSVDPPKVTGRDKILCEDSNSSILLQTPQNSIHRPTPPGTYSKSPELIFKMHSLSYQKF